MSKKAIITVVIAVVVLAVVGGVGFWYVYSQKKPVNSPVVDNGVEVNGDNLGVNDLGTEVKELDLGELELDTSDWLTYRKEEYGFEFKYPASLFIRNDSLKKGGTLGLQPVNLGKKGKELEVYFISFARRLESPEGKNILEWSNAYFEQNARKPLTEKDLLKIGDFVFAFGKNDEITKYHSMFLGKFISDNTIFDIEWYDQEFTNEQGYRIFINMLNTLRSIN